jgi:hypothetical protein
VIDAPGLIHIHPNWGVCADSDGDGTPNYLENANVTYAQGSFGTGNAAGDNFGAAVALADLTRDGFADVAVGIPGEDVGGVSNAGRVTMARGSSLGLQFGLDTSSLFATLPSHLDAAGFGGTRQADGRFGQALASGDFNGDGFADLAVGAPGQDQVFVTYSSIGPTQVFSGSGEFGAALAAADFNGDGFADLAVGAPERNRTVNGVSVSAGAVSVFYGAAAGLSTSPQLIDQGDLPVAADVGKEEAGDRFGAALAAGDLDGGAADLAVGVPGEDIAGVTNAGIVHVIPGKAGQQLQKGQAAARDARSLPAPHAGLQTSAKLGEVLAIGNFRGGGLAVRELAVGVPNQNLGAVTDAGLVALFGGRSPILAGTDPLGSGVQVITLPDVGGSNAAGNRFGHALAVGDYSGDGVKDLAAAAPGRASGGSAGAGEVFLIYGSAGTQSRFQAIPSGGGLVPATAQRLDQDQMGLPAGSREVNDQFGGSFAFPSGDTLAAGDLDRDGQDELFIGTPGEDAGSLADSGFLSIRFGVNVGTSVVTVATPVVRPGGRVTLTLTWTHPSNWHELESIHLRLVGRRGVLAWVRFDEATGLLRLWDPTKRKFKRPGVPGSNARLRTRDAILDLASSRVQGSGPTGRSVTLTITLRLRRHVKPGLYRIEVMATDDHGNSQGFEQVGTLSVVPR